MPPTSRLTAATAPSSVVITLVVPDSVSAICLVSSTLKLSSSAAASLRRSRSSSVRLFITRSPSASSCIDTSSVATRWLPTTRRCTVCRGSSTMSSWSPPIAARPLEPSTPMIVHENCLTRSCSAQRGGAAEELAPHRLADQAHRGARLLLRLLEGAARRERPVVGLEVGVGRAGDAGRPVATVADDGDAGAQLRRHRLDPGDLRQDRVDVGLLNAGAPAAPLPGPSRCPGRTISRLLPRLEIWS